MTAKQEFDAKWFDGDGNIEFNVRNQKEFMETSKEISDYIASLPLSATQNNELVRLLLKLTSTIEFVAFTNGSLFAAGLEELAELEGKGGGRH